MSEEEEAVLQLTASQLQEMIEKAVDAKTSQLRAEVQSEVEVAQEQTKIAQLSKAANEGLHLHTDPGIGYEFAIIPLDKVDFNPLSRREESDYEPEALQGLIADIRKRGGLNRPLLVYRQKGENEGRYMIVKGSRRLAALREMGEDLNHAYILPAKPPIDMEEQWVNGY